eukprot:662223-Karenia_brevis.AAC.1
MALPEDDISKMADAMRTATGGIGETLLLATDGGATGGNTTATRCAGWAAVVAQSDHYTAISGEVPGPDSSSFVAELWAALIIISALAKSGR